MLYRLSQMRAYREVRQILRPVRQAAREMRYPMRRRNRIDEEHIQLVLALSLPCDANCVDVGANYGTVLEHFVTLAPNGHHVAYEPIPGAAAQLRKRFPQVEVHEAVLCDSSGTATFTHVLNDEGRSGLLQHHNYEYTPKVEELTVRAETLDDLPTDFRVDVIKIDVEGAELQVIRGGMRIISGQQPTIFFEHFKGGSEVYETEPKDVWELLVGEASLRLFDIDGAGPLTLADVERRFESQKMWQFVAHR